MDKLIIRKQKIKPNNNLYRIRVAAEAYEKVEQIAEEANLPMTEVCSRMLMFAAERCEIREDD